MSAKVCIWHLFLKLKFNLNFTLSSLMNYFWYFIIYCQSVHKNYTRFSDIDFNCKSVTFYSLVLFPFASNWKQNIFLGCYLREWYILCSNKSYLCTTLSSFPHFFYPINDNGIYISLSWHIFSHLIFPSIFRLIKKYWFLQQIEIHK